MIHDPIADLLTRIRNASQIGQSSVEVPHSRMKESIVKLLLNEGYVRSYETRELTEAPFKLIRILLKYDAKGYPVIRKIQRVSRPGLRKYFSVDKLPRILSGAGVAVVSTSQGLMTDRYARKMGVGGEVICTLY
jgi:small subunit ribosomal protein S8